MARRLGVVEEGSSGVKDPASACHGAAMTVSHFSGSALHVNALNVHLW